MILVESVKVFLMVLVWLCRKCVELIILVLLGMVVSLVWVDLSDGEVSEGL